MAGIGFELKKILRGSTFLSEFRAYLYAAMVSSGPWLISIVCLAALGIYRGAGVEAREHEVFRSTVIYIYAFSLIFSGIVQLVATRCLADRFYEKSTEGTLSTYCTCAVFILGGGVAFGLPAIILFDLSPLYKACTLVLFLLVSMIWISMVFLSAVKDYKSIVYAFACGAVVSIAAAINFGETHGGTGYLGGYLLGQAVTFFWLLARLLRELEPAKFWDSGFVAAFGKYWDLAIIGFLFNMAIWIDKFVFWIAPDSRMIVPWFRTHDLYEGPVFFSYITIVPTLAIFLLKVETSFYEHYRRYYGKIIGKREYSGIIEEKCSMVASLKESVREVFIVQGTITVVCLIFSEQIAGMVRLAPVQVPLFQVALVGSFLQALLAVNVVILFYFDLRRCVLAVTTLFLLSNGGLSWLTVHLGFQYYGYGYTYSCLASLLLAYGLLDNRIRNLEFITFAKQPVV
jgi:polysaccharide biosynthesis protein PelG